MATRPTFTSKTAWAALDVESGEDTDEEVLDETPASQPERYDRAAPVYSLHPHRDSWSLNIPPNSASESSAKPTKSALRKQKALARQVKRQQEKLARAAAKAQAAAAAKGATAADVKAPPQPVTRDQPEPESSIPVAQEPEKVEEPETLPVEELVQQVSEYAAPKPANGAAHPLQEANGSASQPPAPEPVVAPPEPPKYDAPPPPEPKPVASIPSEKEALATRRNDIENPPEEKQQHQQLEQEQAEKAKKKSSFLTRTLWTFIMIGGFISECMLQFDSASWLTRTR